MQRHIKFLFFLISITGLYAQGDNTILNNQGFSVKYLGIESGLSNNAVTALYQDERGFMWIGTYDGLNRYDGYDFQVFRNFPRDSSTLINNRIVSIYGRENEIWVGTKRGLSVYDVLTGQFESRFLKIPSGNAEKILYDINKIGGNSKEIWLATAGKGLLEEDQNGIFQQIPLIHENTMLYDFHAQSFDLDSKGNIWCFVQGIGIVSNDKGNKNLKLRFDQVLSANTVIIDDQDILWVGSDYGLLKYNTISGANQWYSLEHTLGKITDLMFVKELNQVWAGIDARGVVCLDIQNDSFSYIQQGSAVDISSNAVFSLLTDRSGSKWMGTLRGGINILDYVPAQFKTVSKENSQYRQLNSNFILSFCENSQNEIWIGTDGGGASLWNTEKNTFRNFVFDAQNPNSIPNDFVSAIHKNHQGVWFATYGGGIALYDEKTEKFKSYPLSNNILHKNVWFLFEDHQQNLWAASPDGEGLYQYQAEEDYFKFIDAGIYGIISMNQDEEGDFWIGTFDHLVKLDLSGHLHQVIPIGYPVRDILMVENGELLIGTEGGGLRLIDKGTFQQKVFLEEDGLPNNSVLKIVKDETGNYWFSTYNGIGKFDLQTKRITSYFESDGLQSNQFNYNAGMKLSDGSILLGGIKGFNIIHPQANYPEVQFPPLHISNLSINNIPVSELTKNTIFAHKELKLPYEQSMLTFDFVALEYAHGDKISYAYMMEGWDKEWIQSRNTRVANYSRLPEGKYIFHVRSTNENGVWNPEAYSLPITILPPWYRSWWAYSGYGMLILGLLTLFVFYQRKQSYLKYQIALSQLEVKNEHELHEKKLNFFTNISHELRAPLTLIINPLKDLLYGNKKSLDPGEIEEVYRNGKRLLGLVDQLLLFRKVQNEVGSLRIVKLELVAMIKEVFACFIYHAKNQNIDYRFQTDIEETFIYADRKLVETALFNLISNAIKYAPKENGLVEVLLSENDDQVKISVSDNGKGIDERERSKVFELFYQASEKSNGFGIGLYLVKHIMDQHGGKIELVAEDNQLTCFELGFLKGRAHIQNELVHEELDEYVVFPDDWFQKQDEGEKEKELENEELSSYLDSDLLKKQQKILVVDDNPQLLNYIQKILKDTYQITAVDNLKAAYKSLESDPPDLIISDVVLGEENGIDFCKELKMNQSYKHIPIILLTASASESIKLKGVEVGADDYITKPFDRRYLLARIHGILKRQQTIQQYLLHEVTNKPFEQKISKDDKEFLDKAIDYIEEQLGNEAFNVTMLGKHLGMSHSPLFKKIKHLTGKNIKELISFVRLRKVATLLLTSNMQVNQAVLQVGLHDLKHFRQQFLQQYGMTPSEFQKRYKDALSEKQFILNQDVWK
ncbi:two-component regulator propeller domain-containing protein [Belliella marina]|uniref:histidine kinase n=1 Tax=Belliella marina TaxID=1644146 RepID=A0ABW4VNV6_9BACT